MIRVLVVEDDAGLLDDLVFGLRHEGFEASGLAQGGLIDRHLDEHPADVLVLDLGLPDEDGIAIANRLSRDRPNLGIVILTGRKSPQDHVIGLESGADIYLTKTVERRQLVAAIRAVARRVGRLPAATAPLILDTEHSVLRTPDNRDIPLTRTEVMLLVVFARSYGGEASRRALIEGMGAKYLDYDQRRLETLVSRLRRKLTSETGIDNIIRAMRGDGYLFTYPLR